jgi:hypothetical protein
VNGCPASDQVTVFVNNPPAAPIINQVGPDLVTPSPAVFYQWNFNGNPIPGATFPSVFPDQVGNYTVTITDANGCTATSQPFLVTITGLKNLSVNAELRVYPNPAHQLVSVEIPASTSGSTLEIMNALGQSLEQVMIKANANGQKTNLNLETYAPGVYFIRWNGQDGQTVKRLVIE